MKLFGLTNFFQIAKPVDFTGKARKKRVQLFKIMIYMEIIYLSTFNVAKRVVK
jgi:hypothetical protein